MHIKHYESVGVHTLNNDRMWPCRIKWFFIWPSLLIHSHFLYNSERDGTDWCPRSSTPLKGHCGRHVFLPSSPLHSTSPPVGLGSFRLQFPDQLLQSSCTGFSNSALKEDFICVFQMVAFLFFPDNKQGYNIVNTRWRLSHKWLASGSCHEYVNLFASKISPECVLGNTKNKIAVGHIVYIYIWNINTL